jgi:hypothetical protein
MRRQDLEHIIRACTVIADDNELIILGSQAILGQFPHAPAELCASNEADVYPKNHPERWELIDGTIGELSPFHETYGYYAQGVEEGTAVLPAGWEARLIAITGEGTRGAIGWCLEVHDLAISKYVAGRDKDRRYLRAAVRSGLLDQATLVGRLAVTALEPTLRERIAELIRCDFGQLT